MNTTDPVVLVHVPSFPIDQMPSMRPDDDSISTFQPGKAINLADDQDSEDKQKPSLDDPKSVASKTTTSPVSILRTTRTQDDATSKISCSDSITRISSLETEFSLMNKKFQDELDKLQFQALQQAKEQLLHGSMLTEILTM